ncbi:hypothetical protein L195_g063942, partial [Trifolium pratense]
MDLAFGEPDCVSSESSSEIEYTVLSIAGFRPEPEASLLDFLTLEKSSDFDFLVLEGVEAVLAFG